MGACGHLHPQPGFPETEDWINTTKKYLIFRETLHNAENHADDLKLHEVWLGAHGHLLSSGLRAGPLNSEPLQFVSPPSHAPTRGAPTRILLIPITGKKGKLK